MRVHVNHHGSFSLACFFSGLSASLRPAPARRQHTLRGCGLMFRQTTRQRCAVIVFAASDRSIRFSEFAKAELSDLLRAAVPQRNDAKCQRRH